MRKVIAVSALLFSASSFAAVGIPVADNPAAIVRAVEWAQLGAQWAKTLTQYKNELSAYKSQLETATGSRDIGGFMGEIKNLKGQLDGYKKRSITLDDMLSSSGGLSTDAERIFNKYKLFELCKGQDQVTMDGCKEDVVNKAATLETAETISKELRAKINDASALAARAERSKDSKESQDLSNAIGIKNMEITALQTQWNIYTQQSQAREKLLEEKRSAAFRKRQGEGQIPRFNIKY